MNRNFTFGDSDTEIYRLLMLMSEIGLNLKVDKESDASAAKSLISNFKKSVLPYISEFQPIIKIPEYDSKANYYFEFWKGFISNEILIASLKEASLEKVLMDQKLEEYEKNIEMLQKGLKPNLKKRRLGQEIHKLFRVKKANFSARMPSVRRGTRHFNLWTST